MNPRRHFIGQCCAAVGTTGMLSALTSLRATAAAVSLPSSSPNSDLPSPNSGAPARARAVPSDYRALVCIFLNGGNDSSNLLVPHDPASYASYAAARSVLALPHSSLLPIAPRTTDGRAFAFHPGAGELKDLFGTGKLALLANVGTLAYPTTKAQYLARSVPLPTQLFSHADQQAQWESSVPDQPFKTGWGGRLGDLLGGTNTDPKVSMSMTLDGYNNFQVGTTITQLAVQRANGPTSKGGPTPWQGAGTAGPNGVRHQAQRDLFNAPNPNLFAAAFGSLTTGAIADSELLSAALAAAPILNTAFPDSTLGGQLKTIAHLISISSTLNLRRQVFFARIRGFDTHADQITTNPTTGAHADLLAQVSQAVHAFYQATVELGIDQQVTAFTTSDFGRTFTSNSSGSDHGWGGHQFVVGGAVKGGDIYGRMPTAEIGGPDDTGLGRWIPTTSVDEYSATLATWFGVSATNLSVAFPNIGRFAKPNLGFV